jgi:hypothetical protein
MADQIRVDWDYLAAARKKYRQLVREIEAGADHQAKLEHTASKLGIFLDTALNGAFSGSDVKAPDTVSAVDQGGEPNGDR